MRKWILSFGAVLVVGFAFIGGYYFGYQRGLVEALGLSARVDAFQNLHVLEQLESGRIKEAKNTLNSNLNNNVLEIQAFTRRGADQTAAEDAILKAAAEFRKQYPYADPAGPDVEKRIREILSRGPAQYLQDKASQPKSE